MSDDSRKLDLGDAPEKDTSGVVSGWDYLADGNVIRCAFSTTRKTKIGMGGSARTRESLVLWYVEQVTAERFEVRKLNPNNVPAGDAEVIPMHRLVNEFTPQLAHYEKAVFPAMQALEETLKQGDEHRDKGRLYSAEMEYDRALCIEEHNVRALFGLGLVFLGRKEFDRTRDLLTELVEVKSAFDGKNQHLFNEFGIALRKFGLFNEAVVYYRRALDFVKDDENLYYNLARAYYESGDWDNCLECLIHSHRINPGLKLARDLFQVIVGLAENEQLLMLYDKPPVPSEVAGRARKILAVETGKLTLDVAPLLRGMASGRARSGDAMNLDANTGHPDDFGDD